LQGSSGSILFMIQKGEIETKAKEFDIKIADVERDYVFGWFLKAVYENDYLSDLLILKGGNAFRKGYFPDTRFSLDLDFSTQKALDLDLVQKEINRACQQAGALSGISFDIERNRLSEGRVIDNQKQVYKGQIYFRDFYGNATTITISIRLDITEFDKLYLEPVKKSLIHPYSDVSECQAEIKCMALEELLANKLKCLTQRRHSNDLYDLVYATFVAPPKDLDRRLVASTFLKKTIFEQSPSAAQAILLGIPLNYFKGIWNRYIVCPLESRFDFDTVEGVFKNTINSLFEQFDVSRQISSFVKSEHRNPILDAGLNRQLVKVGYGGVVRDIEPYALSYKRRRDGKAFEYFYGYDRTGGSSGPGIKAFLPFKIESVEATDIKFDPRFDIELGKAGESNGSSYFSSKSNRGYSRKSRRKFGVSRRLRDPFAQTFKVQCSACGKKFTRKTSDQKIRKHKTPVSVFI